MGNKISYGINIYIYRTSSNLYTPDSVSLASLARQLVMCSYSTIVASELVQHNYKL